MQDESLDFIFIDAGHEYEDVIEDITCWYSKVRPGGHIMGHDIDQPQVRKAVKEKFQDRWSWAKRQKIWFIKK